jgi:uncharacterized protein GlcG (DUF336 family)
MRLRLGLLCAAALALGAAGAFAQGASPKHVITGPAAEDIGETNMINAATARAISEACEKRAAERNMGAAIVILDQFGNKVHQHRMDQSARYTAIHTAELKAETALLTRRPSSLRMFNVQQDPNQVAREFGMGYFPNAGGLPIWSGKQIIGFIGVGGMNPTPQWSDEICAHQALTEVLGPQPPLPTPPARN